MIPIDELYVQIGERIKYAREARGWTQQQLGDAAGYSQATIGNYEAARRHPGIDDLYKLGEALGKTYAYFLGAEKDQQEEAREKAVGLIQQNFDYYVGIRMLPVLREPVANSIQLQHDPLSARLPTPREFSQKADTVFQVGDSHTCRGLVPGDYVYIRRQGSGQQGQIVLASVEGCIGLVTCSFQDGYLWTDSGEKIRQSVTVVGEFCGLYTEGAFPTPKADEAEPSSLWADLPPDDRRQVEEFIAFLRARRAGA